MTDVGGGYSYREYSHYALYFSVRQNEITENEKKKDQKESSQMITILSGRFINLVFFSPWTLFKFSKWEQFF